MSRNGAPVSGDRRVTVPRGVRLLIPLVAIAGFFAILMFAAAQQGLPQFGDLPGRVQERRDDDSAPSIPGETTPPPIEPAEDSLLLRIVGTVLAILVVVAVLTLLFFGVRMLLRYLRGLWRDRPLARRAATEVDSAGVTALATDPEPDAAVIRRGIDEALRTIDTRPVPGDGIVAAWVGLEESAADAGAGRAINETPSEFTVRIVARRARITSDVVMLLALYERVRFGGLEADERDRATAAACLRGIQEGWR